MVFTISQRKYIYTKRNTPGCGDDKVEDGVFTSQDEEGYMKLSHKRLECNKTRFIVMGFEKCKRRVDEVESVNEEGSFDDGKFIQIIRISGIFPFYFHFSSFSSFTKNVSRPHRSSFRMVVGSELTIQS